MSHSMLGNHGRFSLVVTLALLIGLGGCTTSPPASDGGPGSDSGSAPGTDTGSATGAPHFTATVTGAHGGSYDYTESHSLSGNYVTCSNPTGFLAITAALAAGSDPSFTLYIHEYTGPATYNLTFNPGAASDTIEARTGGGYAYEYFYDTSRVDFHEVDSMCTLVINGSTAHITGTIACTHFPAEITSPDYEDMQTDLQPSVDMNGTFDCDVD